MPGSHFEDEWDEVPAVGAGVSSEARAVEDELAGRRSPGSVQVKVEVQERPAGGEEASGGAGEDEEGGENGLQWPRLFVCVRQLVMAKGGAGAAAEVLCMVDAQDMGQQRVFSASGASVTMWDPASGQAKATFPRRRPPALVEGHQRRVSSLAVARIEGQDSLFTGSMDGSVIMWDVFSGQSHSPPTPRERGFNPCPHQSPPVPVSLCTCPSFPFTIPVSLLLLRLQ